MRKLIYCIDKDYANLYVSRHGGVYLNPDSVNNDLQMINKFSTVLWECDSDIIVTDHWLFSTEPFEISQMFFLTYGDEGYILTNIQDCCDKELRNIHNIPKLLIANTFDIVNKVRYKSEEISYIPNAKTIESIESGSTGITYDSVDGIFEAILGKQYSLNEEIEQIIQDNLIELM